MVVRAGFEIRVRGVVQGVGFRPFVWQLAHQAGLAGTVANDGEGVHIVLCCDAVECAVFMQQLQLQCPPLARIHALESSPVQLEAMDEFAIIASQQGDIQTGCAADAASCPQCLSELNDPVSRRYRYPFINCTHCGPRLSIVQSIPWDRPHTSMSVFTMCPACQAEYDNPADRRFHAQPNACPVCGPQLWLETPDGAEMLPPSEVFGYLQEQLSAGQILAIRGLGGFHLACDATNAAAVARLRQGKARPDKPLALMVANLEVLARYGQRTVEADQALQSPAAPIVLLDKVADCELPDAVAPGQAQLGFMLPSTPLHHLLFAALDVPLVMTSGNRSGQPQAISNDEARQRLAGIADLLVLHNREILNRLDDSVLRQTVRGPQLLRRARGYAPQPLLLPPGFEEAEDLLALGAELKNTLCLISAGQAILSQHLGDLSDAHSYDNWEQTIGLYRQLYQHKPALLAHDMHPDYRSSQYAFDQQRLTGIPLAAVQHHHAHIASCLGEHDYPRGGAPVLGICFDGTGYGEDGTLWGGEFLQVDYCRSTKLGGLLPVPLIGGSQAIREPWRNLFAQLEVAQPGQGWADRWSGFAARPLATLRAMVKKQLNCPLSSSAGRLFDAVAAALDCSFSTITYEGQAAIELEALARGCTVEVAGYPLARQHCDGLWQLDPAPMWRALLADLKADRPAAEIAMAFQLGLAEQSALLADQLAARQGLETVVLSGGVMQNQCFQQRLACQLQAMGYQVLLPQQLPANDGGIAFGQALVASARQLEFKGTEQ